MTIQNIGSEFISTSGNDLRAIWRSKKIAVAGILRNNLSILGALKSRVAVTLSLNRENREIFVTLKINNLTILESTNIRREILTIVLEQLLEKIAHYTREGSG